jgi:hypothetical protein
MSGAKYCFEPLSQLRRTMMERAGGCKRGEGKERKRFFFEKKKQKTFAYCGRRQGRSYARRLAEVFWFFFQKKNRLLTL